MCKIVIKAVGDSLVRRKDGGNPFGDICDEIDSSDLFLINLEAVLIFDEENLVNSPERSILLFSHPNNLDYLSNYKDKIVFTLSNNHIYDYGIEGYIETIKFLSYAGFRYALIDKPLEINIKNKKIKIFAVHDGLHNAFNHSFFEDDYQLDSGDINILSIHWGQEHILIPSLKQIEIAKKFINKGGSVIYGHHSHTAQGVLHYKQKPIFFSLGNCNIWQFDVPMQNYNRKGYIAKTNFNGDCIMSISRVPFLIDDNYVPRLDTRESRYEELTQLDELMNCISKFSKYRFLLFYLVHQSKSNIVNNIIGGWVPRIRKYGKKHLFMMLRWFFYKRTILSFFLMPFCNYNNATKLLKKINNA